MEDANERLLIEAHNVPDGNCVAQQSRVESSGQSTNSSVYAGTLQGIVLPPRLKLACSDRTEFWDSSKGFCENVSFMFEYGWLGTLNLFQ